MKSSTRWLTLLLLIIAALGSYSIGFMRGVMLFVVIGILFELAFWVGLFRSNSKQSEE